MFASFSLRWLSRTVLFRQTVVAFMCASLLYTCLSLYDGYEHLQSLKRPATGGRVIKVRSGAAEHSVNSKRNNTTSHEPGFHRNIIGFQERCDDKKCKGKDMKMNVMSERRHHHDVRKRHLTSSEDPIVLREKSGKCFDAGSVLLRLRSNASSWRFRQDNLMQLRKQIHYYAGEDLIKSAFLSRANTPLNSTIMYYKIHHTGKLKVTERFWNQLPKTSVYTGKHYRTCSVVGSSGLLTGQRCGLQIDSSDLVFRMNNAPTSKKYEDDVGKRTSQISMTGKSLIKLSVNTAFNGSCIGTHNTYPENVFQNSLPVVYLIRLPTYPVTKFMRLVSEGCQMVPTIRGQLVLGNPRFAPKMNGFWRQHGIDMKISSGLYSLTLALHLCDQTHVYGFWPFDVTPEGTAVAYHYYDLLTIKKVIHEFIKEYELLVRLHELGIIQLHVEQCNNDK